MSKSVLAFILIASVAPLPPMLAATAARPAFADEAELPGPDTQFLAKAIIGGRSEGGLSQLAASKASQAEVRQFAEHLVRDHTALNDKLMAEAQQHKIRPGGTYGTPPLEPDEPARTAKQRLEGLSGSQFDKEYVRHMIQVHTQDIAQFQEEAKNGKDTRTRDLASAALPTLEDHLKQAREIGARIGVQT